MDAVSCTYTRNSVGCYAVAALILHCRLLARETIPSALVFRILSAAFDVAEANSPSLLVLDDLVGVYTLQQETLHFIVIPVAAFAAA